MKKVTFLLCIIIILAAATIVVVNFTLEDIEVVGCEAVDEQKVKDALWEQRGSGNTIGLYLTCKMKDIEGIPFVSKLEAEIVAPHKLRVNVYEKKIAGCVEYMNSYIYFDKDGIILDSMTRIIEGVPKIEGLTFEKWEAGEQLPISDKGKFDLILTVTQLIDKYAIDIKKVKFTAGNEVVLYYKDIQILLGDGKNLSIQFMNLGSILENLEGMSGTLYMKDFDSSESTASFRKN